MGIHSQFPIVDRKAIADEIERLIMLLDMVDGDCDLEETGDREDTHDREEDPSWLEWEDPSKPPVGAEKSLEAHMRRIHRTACTAKTYGRNTFYQLREAF
jgi:hypothetical protein